MVQVDHNFRNSIEWGIELEGRYLSHIIFTDKMKIPLIFILGFHGFMKHLLLSLF